MSDWTDNPFAQPSKPASAALADPSVNAAAPPEYNPFDTQAKSSSMSFSKPAPPPRPAAAPVADEPAWAKPGPKPVAASAGDSRPAPPTATGPSDDDIRRQQEYEEREAAALKYKESLSKVTVIEGRPANFPPFKGCPGPLKPCFHLNMGGEIPPPYRRAIRVMYYLWYYTCFCLLFNFIGCLASLAWYGAGVSTSTGLSSLWLVAFIICSFCCWFHPIYTAFRTNSNLRYGWFFFVTFFQLIFSGLMALGVPYTGGAGLILALQVIGAKKNSASVPIFLSGLFWTIHFFWTLFMLRWILKMYRSAGGSMSKINQEWKQEGAKGLVKVAQSDTGKELAATAVTSAATAKWGEPDSRA